MARTKRTARMRTGGPPPPRRMQPTPMVGMHVAVFRTVGAGGGNIVPVPGTVVYVTPSKRRVHVQSEGQLTLFSLRMTGQWLPVGAALHAQDCWLDLEPDLELELNGEPSS